MDPQAPIFRNVRARPELGLSASSALPIPQPSRGLHDDDDTQAHRISVLRITDTELPSYTFPSSLRKRLSRRKRPRKTGRKTRGRSLIPDEGVGERESTEDHDGHPIPTRPCHVPTSTSSIASERSTSAPTRTEGKDYCN